MKSRKLSISSMSVIAEVLDMKDYKISELIHICQTHRKCKSCPAVELCDIIDQYPESWELNLEDEKEETGNRKGA